MTSDLVMPGSYNYGLVALSILIAMLGSYATIDLAARVRAAQGGARLSWRVGGATAMAIGTWAMHYTGMLAFRLPVPILYDWPTSLLSFLLGLLASAVALIVVIRPKMELLRAFVASIFIGGGIAGLHYTAMASMRMQAGSRYSPALVALSVLLAMVFSLLSIWLTFLFRDRPRGWKLRKAGGVALMGTAIWIMHYTGMASASFRESATAPDLSHAVNISSLDAVGIGAVALSVLVVALMGSTVDRLQKQQALLDSLFEQSPEAVALMDLNQRIVRVNGEFTSIFGYTSEESIGRSLRELIIPHEFQEEAQGYADLAARGQRVDAEGVRQRKDQSRLQVSIIQMPVSSRGGQVAVYAIYRDITERKRAEDDLRRQKEILQTIIDNIPVMIRFSGPDDSILINRAWEQTLGWSVEEVQRRKLDVFSDFYPDPDERRRALDFIAAATGEWADFKIRVRDGRIIDATFASIRLSDRTNISIGQNITERKQAEERLNATTEQLRRLSARLQAAKEEEAIRIAREIHDELGATLSSLRWDLEDVDEVISGSKERLNIEELRRKIAAMMKLTDTTVNTVRRIASELRPMALDTLGLSETIEWQARQFQERTGIVVQCDCDPGSLDLTGEQSTAVFRILQEALTNVLRHAQATMVRIQLNTENGKFIMTVSDNGRGITNDQKSDGRTLGLLGMRERAHLIGGEVEITGSPGKGTIVIVRIPFSGKKGYSEASQ